MKALRELLVGSVAALFGFALGSIGNEALVRPTPIAKPSSLPPAITTASSTNDETIAEVMSVLLARGSFRELAHLRDQLDTLDSTHMRALLERVWRLPPAERAVFFPRLLAYWTKRDPHAATNWIQPHLEVYAKDRQFANGFANFDTALVQAWAGNAPQLAVDLARKHSGTGLARTVLHAAIFEWPDKSYAHRFELLRGFPAGNDRQKVVVSLCFTWAQFDPQAALAGAASLPHGVERDCALTEVLARFAAKEPASAFKQAEKFEISDPALLAVMTKEGAKSDPIATATWIENQPSALVADLGPTVAVFWAQRDPAAAFAWALKHGIPLTNTLSGQARATPSEMFARHAGEMLGESPFAAALRVKPDETIAWVRSLPSGAERDRYLELASRASAPERRRR